MDETRLSNLFLKYIEKNQSNLNIKCWEYCFISFVPETNKHKS